MLQQQQPVTQQQTDMHGKRRGDCCSFPTPAYLDDENQGHAAIRLLLKSDTRLQVAHKRKLRQLVDPDPREILQKRFTSRTSPPCLRICLLRAP